MINNIVFVCYIMLSIYFYSFICWFIQSFIDSYIQYVFIWFIYLIYSFIYYIIIVYAICLLCGEVCVVTKDLHNKAHLPGDVSSAVGWIEKDGKLADYPTDESENVYAGDTVDIYVEVHISPCYSWSVYISCIFVDLHSTETEKLLGPTTRGIARNLFWEV